MLFNFLTSSLTSSVGREASRIEGVNEINESATIVDDDESHNDKRLVDVDVTEDDVESVLRGGINNFSFLLGLDSVSTWLWYSAKALFFSFAAIFGTTKKFVNWKSVVYFTARGCVIALKKVPMMCVTKSKARDFRLIFDPLFHESAQTNYSSKSST